MRHLVRVGLGWVWSDQLGPLGLCADRSEHDAHLHDSRTLGPFWCTADQSQREPWRSERRRASPPPLPPSEPST